MALAISAYKFIMSRILKITSYMAVFFTVYIIPLTHNVYAQYPDLPSPVPLKPFNVLFVTKFLNPSRTLPTVLISAFLPAILGLAGFLAVIIIVISGIQFITSSGNPEAAAGAKNRLIFALVGFALIVLAFAILQIVNRLFLNSGVV